MKRAMHHALHQHRRAWLIACLIAGGCHVPQADAGPASTDASGAKAQPVPNDARRERIEHLAPLPKNAITGEDADQDHIRDDVAQYIDQQPYARQEGVRLAARQYARAEQHGLAYARDPNRSQDAGDEITRGIECLYAFVPAEEADAIWKELQARTIDTEERAQEFFALQDALAGGYFESSPERVQSCAFDMTGVAP
jgi:hypothetical protein